LLLPIKGDLIICPEQIIQRLVKENLLGTCYPFMRNQGNVLLINKNNPKQITGINDLIRPDIRLFISNPDTEKVSHQGYRKTVENILDLNQLDHHAFSSSIDNASDNIVFGEKIHHREAPQVLANNLCDVAIVYYHLALRYKRIFPGMFSIIPLGGTEQSPEPLKGNLQNQLFVAEFKTENNWAKPFLDCLLSDESKAIYEKHGLRQ